MPENDKNLPSWTDSNDKRGHVGPENFRPPTPQQIPKIRPTKPSDKKPANPKK